MCELEVIVEKEVAFENVIYAKSIGNRVVVKDILGKIVVSMLLCKKSVFFP